MAEATANFPTLFNDRNAKTEGNADEAEDENAMGSSNALSKYGLLNYVFAVIQKSRLTYTEVFELPMMDFLVITNYVVDESNERAKEFKRQQIQFKNRSRR